MFYNNMEFIEAALFSERFNSNLKYNSFEMYVSIWNLACIKIQNPI